MLNLDFKPGIKKEISVYDFKTGKRNLINGIDISPIGTGFELEYLLNLVNESSTLLGFLGKHPLDYYRKLLPLRTIERFIDIKDRVYEENILLGEENTVLYNEVKITKEEITDFLNLYDTLLNSHNFVVGFDIIEMELPVNFYEKLLKITKIKNKEFYLELKSESVLRSLGFMPDFAIISDSALDFLKYMYPTTHGLVDYLKSLGLSKFIINRKSDGYIINLENYMEIVEVKGLSRYDNLGLMAGIVISKLKEYSLKETLDVVKGFYLSYNKYRLDEINTYKIKEEYGRKNG